MQDMENIMLVNVKEAKYVKDFILELSILVIDNNSNKIVHKEVDLENYIFSKKLTGIFAPLREIEYFKNFKLNANTIEWQNGADIAPERFLEI